MASESTGGAGSDETLARQVCHAGDRDAFGDLYDRHVQVVYRYCARRIPDPAQAEDLVSITFLEAWRCRHRMTVVDGSVRAWFLGIARNVLRSHARSSRRYEQALERYRCMEPDACPDPATVVDEHLSAAAQARLMWDQIQCLPPRDREVAELCLIEGLSLQQAATALGRRPAAVKSRLHRIRVRLRALLQEGDEVNPGPRYGHDMDERTPRSPTTALELT